MLDLGKPGAVLHLFQCLECGGIGNDASRAAFILDESQLTDHTVTVPGFDRKPELGEKLIGEFWIDGWTERDDGIPPERLPEFFTCETWNPLTDDYPAIQWFDPREATRFGGSPRWTGNGPSSPYSRSFEFLLQCNNDLYIDGPPPTADDVGGSVFRFPEETTEKPGPGAVRMNAPWLLVHEAGETNYRAEYTNLGTDGTLFVFINRQTSPHQVRWYWTR